MKKDIRQVEELKYRIGYNQSHWRMMNTYELLFLCSSSCCTTSARTTITLTKDLTKDHRAVAHLSKLAGKPVFDSLRLRALLQHGRNLEIAWHPHLLSCKFVLRPSLTGNWACSNMAVFNIYKTYISCFTYHFNYGTVV